MIIIILCINYINSWVKVLILLYSLIVTCSYSSIFILTHVTLHAIWALVSTSSREFIAKFESWPATFIRKLTSNSKLLNWWAISKYENPFWLVQDVYLICHVLIFNSNTNKLLGWWFNNHESIIVSMNHRKCHNLCSVCFISRQSLQAFGEFSYRSLKHTLDLWHHQLEGLSTLLLQK